jgi:aminoglycoside/choline kinase family phosphotransferase
MKEQLVFFLKDYFGSENISISQLQGDASSRIYFRVTYKGQSFILCKDSSSDNFNRFLQAAKWLKSNEIPVPEIYREDKDNLLVLQEDLGSCSLEYYRTVNPSPDIQQLLYQTIDIMVSVHQIPVNKEIFLYNWSFDKDKLKDELQMMRTFFWQRFLKQSWKAEHEEVFNFLHHLFQQIPYVLVHRDFHSRNIYYKNHLYMIDFQDARLGPITYDLVSLLEDPYSPMGRKDKNNLKRYFFEKYSEHYSVEELSKWYNIVAIQRLFKILGSFTYLSYEKGKDGYLQYIPLTIKNLFTVLQILEIDIKGVDIFLAPLRERI